MKNEPEFRMKTEHYDVSYPEYYNMTKRFGAFSEDGTEYTVTDRNTPRQWFSIMSNDRFASVMSNDGHGFLAYRALYLRMTKHFNETDYLLRHCNGERPIVAIDETGKEYDLFAAEDLTFTVRAGECEYTGSIGQMQFDILFFVPKENPVECIQVNIKSVKGSNFTLKFTQDWAYYDHRRKPRPARISNDVEVTPVTDGVRLSGTVHAMGKIYAFCRWNGAVATENAYTEHLKLTDDSYVFHRVTLQKAVTVQNGEVNETIVSGVTAEHPEALWDTFGDAAAVEKEHTILRSWWEEVIHRNYCELPDKTMQHLLNVWLKNQVYVTSQYNRFGVMGYRDILQDAWGVRFVEPKRTRKHILLAAEHMYDDGRCPRQFDIYDAENIDRRDFSDSPIWLPIALTDYIKETGDFDILKEDIAFLDSTARSTLLDHVLRSLDYLYHSRGKNGLILMRGGDWLDGLEGINKWGEATSVWVTVATYYAQTLTAELLDEIGQNELAETLRMQCAEYKDIVNTVGWNGKWYSYAFIDDEAIGHPDAIEGKIYLNVQTWAIFSGIADAEKTRKLMRGVDLYLSTPYGPQLLAPPYSETGEHYGRLRTQRPGTFANSAIYLHGASFKIYADMARGEPEVAYDTFMRILPGHVDNPDCRRTGEPYAVGNVYYGQAHQCPGFNLYGWFSATPSWLIHGGFEQLLGVRPTYHGLEISPLRLEDWDGYTVQKVYRGTRYHIIFRKGERDRITLDGKEVSGTVVCSENDTAEVMVEYTY